MQVSNAGMQNGATQTNSLNALFQNCIFWGDFGNVPDEISVDKEGANIFTINFDHVIYKAADDISNVTFTSSIKNMDPVFDSIDITHQYYDFHLGNNSPAIDKGVNTSFPLDLDDKPRDSKPDLGCYEK